MDWEKLKIFRYVAQEQSFTHAGIKLNLSQSAASRQIKKLEEDIGVMLFHRHARGLLLTEQGETLLKYANEVFDKISLAENSLTINKEEPEGSLRVATTITFGSVWLTSYIDEFLDSIKFFKKFEHIDSEHYLHQAQKAGKKILAEGAQGTLLDIDFGTYPYVKCSNPSIGSVLTGLGISPTKVRGIYCTVKVYCIRVDDGP